MTKSVFIHLGMTPSEERLWDDLVHPIINSKK